MSTALATPANNARTILDVIQSDRVKAQVALALPKFCTPDRMIRIALSTINSSAKLQECTTESLLLSLMKASQMGIECDGRNGHLIPRWNKQTGKTECTFMPDYKGLVGLVRKNGGVSDVYSDVICANDTIKITKGLHRDLIHEPPHLSQPRGPVIGAYAVIAYKDGGAPSFDVMSKEEIDYIRSRSQSANSGPWVTDYAEMAKKTVLKRLLKLADLNPDTAERVALDVEAHVEPVTEPARFATPQIEAPAETAPRRRTMRLVKGETVETPPVASEPAAPATPPVDDPLPGAEVERVEPAITAHELHIRQLRDQHPEYNDAQILAVLVKFKLADNLAKSLADVSPTSIERAMEDPATFGNNLALSDK